MLDEEVREINRLCHQNTPNELETDNILEENKISSI